MSADRPGLLALGLAAFLAATSVQAAGLSIAGAAARPGSEVRLQVRVSGVSALYGAGFDLRYDPALLGVSATRLTSDDTDSPDVREAGFASESGREPVFTLSAHQDGAAGRLVIGLTRVRDANGLSTASARVLLTLGMRTLAVGVASLSLERVVLRDAAGNPMAISTTSTAVVEISTGAVNRAPRADAGRERTVRPGRRILLDATGSFDSDGNPLEYRWRQTDGLPLDLGDVTRPAIPLVAPAATRLGFEVSVSDGAATSRSAVAVLVSGALNTPPRVAASTPSLDGSGIVLVPYALSDDESDPCTVSVRFSTDGTTYRTAAAAISSPTVRGLATNSEGLPYLFVWNAADDLGARRVDGVRLELAAWDADAGAPALLGPFAVDQSRLSLPVRLQSPAAGSSHPEADDVFFSGGATTPEGRELDGAELVWTSGVPPAEIGRGREFYRRLPAGDPTVTLTAASASGLRGSTSVALQVIPAPASARMQLELDRGPNLVALPLDPGTTAHPYSMGDLLRDAGAGFAVRTANGPSGDSRFVLSERGSPEASRTLSGNEAYLVLRPDPATVTLLARPWPSGQGQLELGPGWRWLALPSPPTSHLTAADLARIASSPVVVETTAVPSGAVARFRIYQHGSGLPPFSLRPDRGYGVFVRSRRTIVLPGGAP